MSGKVKKLSELKLAVFRVLCPGDQYLHEIKKASIRLKERMGDMKHLVNPSVLIGAFKVADYSDDEDGYWIGVQVEEYLDIPEDMITLTIPAQSYVTGMHHGPNHQIMDTYSQLHRWMEANQHDRALYKWHIEIHHSWSDVNKLEIELLDTIE
ncbi:GyrI-like domain-containing protein [Sediminibacillus massiliensis]|uniref:GyrI-like domain-containing protein n=1 Tax=Sediminibacillus massiliensis TaxID=1926277 RepID=UPI001FEB0821|nr:GyrI-like domain-containing protein [Sediminibacillus massiliensis]